MGLVLLDDPGQDPGDLSAHCHGEGVPFHLSPGHKSQWHHKILFSSSVSWVDFSPHFLESSLRYMPCQFSSSISSSSWWDVWTNPRSDSFLHISLSLLLVSGPHKTWLLVRALDHLLACSHGASHSLCPWQRVRGEEYTCASQVYSEEEMFLLYYEQACSKCSRFIF